MIDANMIKNLPIESRKKLVDYIEGLPDSLKKLIRLILLENYMDGSFFKSKERKISEYSTIKKYMDKKTIEEISNPACSCYQQAYCDIMYNIYSRENNFPHSVQYALDTILNAECYNIDTLIKVEVYIGDFIKNLETNRELMLGEDKLIEIISFINLWIMLYKFKVYDFYTYLELNQDIRLRESDYSHMAKMHDMITRLITSKPGLTALNDIGTLIYIYFKDLGMDIHIQKYRLFDRFKYTMKYCNISDEDIAEVENRISECENSKLSSMNAASILINSSKLNDSDTDEKMEIPVMSGSSNIDENNGYIFSFKNVKDIEPDKLDELSISLRGLNMNEILQYSDINPDHVTFELTDNDIGHIRNENKINIGTTYSSFDKEIRYIIEREGEFYLLFKDMMNSRIVYGLSCKRYPSTEEYDKPRKLITIKENTNFSYKYISEI